MLDDAMWHMQCQYNYQIIDRPTSAQVSARTAMGELAAQALQPIADDLILAGIRTYLQYLGWNDKTARSILVGPQDFGLAKNAEQ